MYILYTFMFFSNSAYEAVNETHIFAKYRFRAIFYILVCLNRAIFKESIGGSNSGVEKVKKRSLNPKLVNLPIYAFFWCQNPFDTPGLAKYRLSYFLHFSLSQSGYF